jgi:hypothetical protein
MAQGHFEFPGFTFTGVQASGPNHEVNLGKIESGGVTFVLTMLRGTTIPDLPFMLASVATDGKVIWTFEKSFNGVGLLAKAGDELVVAIVGKGKTGKVEQIIPFSTLVGDQRPDVIAMLNLKKAAANFLRREYDLTDIENRVVKIASQRILLETEAEEKRRREEREHARIEMIKRIVQRPRLTGYTSNGWKMYGLPVLETEWQSLQDGTYAILVESIGVDGPGKMIEAFRVVKERGKDPKKGSVASVTASMPIRAATSVAIVTRSRSEILIERDGKFLVVEVYGSMDAIREARLAGLNGGTLVTDGATQKNGKVVVLEVHTNEVKTVGEFAPLS